MKYLKMFENHDKYYEEIPTIISQRLNSEYRQSFSDYEYQKLISIIEKKFSTCGSIRRDDNLEISFGETPNKSSLFVILILKYPDDWFYLTITPNKHWTDLSKRTFKCDQFDGLIRCLRDQFDLDQDSSL